MTTFKKKYFSLIAIILSSLIGLSLGEVYIRMFVPVRNVGENFTIFDQVYGKRIKKNLNTMRKTPEFKFRFVSNSLGYRCDEINPKKESILFLGDSFTEGYGVNNDEMYTTLLGHALNSQIINAGMGDTGNGHWVKFLNREANKYNIKILVFQFTPNDFKDNVREKLFEKDSNGDIKENPLLTKNKIRQLQWIMMKAPYIEKAISNSYIISLFKQFRRGQIYNKYELYRENNDIDKELTYKLLEKAFYISKEHNFKTAFVLVNSKKILQVEINRIKELCKKYEIIYVESPSKKERPDLFYKVDAHWNAQGHRFIANLLFENLNRQIEVATKTNSIKN